MTPFVFDTLSASKQLREAGMAEGVAEAVVSVFQHAGAMPDISHLATREQVEALKADVDRVRSEMATKTNLEALRLATRADMELLRAETRADIEALRIGTKADIEALSSEMKSEFKAVRREMATKDDLAQARLDVANFRASITDAIRQQGWMLLGGVGVLVTILNGLMKMFG